LSGRSSSGPADTEALAAELAARLEPGDVVLIAGELGAGKTTFVRGASRALGVTDPVVSPTFTIGRRYRGRVPVSHLDLYRLDDPGAEDPGLLDDYLTADAITFVEWPGRLAEPWENVAARVTIRHAGGDERLVSIEA
jgi:tRNA threonylcarbamoyladenosine biosynthesis protein TsaE